MPASGMAGCHQPLALVLVRNTVTYDARVARESETLGDVGFKVLVAGVISSGELTPPPRLGAAQIVRLAPAALAGGWLRRLRPGHGAPSDAVPPSGPANRQEPRSTTGSNALVRWLARNVVTAAYYAQAGRLAWRIAPALVHANDYNTMWIGVAAKLLRGSRLVYDSHELWADRNGRPEWRPWLVACEALFVRVADANITTSPGYADAIARRYRVAAPLVVRNIPPRASTSTATRAPAADQSLLAIYVGGLMPGRGLEQAIDALEHAPSTRLRFIGPGQAAYVAQLRRRATAGGLQDRVEFRPPVPPSEVPAAVADGDVGLMLIQPICRSYELTLPNKLFEYAAAGLPILTSDLAVIGPLVRDADIGAAIPPDNVVRIADALERLGQPAENARVRAHVVAFAQRETWERERTILETVYRPNPENDRRSQEPHRVTEVYRRYGVSPRKRRTWSSDKPGNRAIRDELVDTVFALAGPSLPAARAILDIGCGTGWWLARLAADQRISARLHGIELLPDRATAAQRRVPSARVQLADARELPFAPKSFDVVTLFTVLSSLGSVSAVELVLAEARRTLAPGGVLLVWEPRLPTPNRATLHIAERLLRRSLAGARIESVSTTVAPPIARRLGSRTARLYPRLARLPALRTHRLLCARFA